MGIRQKQLWAALCSKRAVTAVMLLLACLLMGWTLSLLIEATPGPPYAQVFASRSSAEVTLFSQTRGAVHTFDLRFHGEVGNPCHCGAGSSGLCLTWSDSARLTVTKGPARGQHTVSASAHVPFKVCFRTNGARLWPVFGQRPSNLTGQPLWTPDCNMTGISIEEQRYWYTSEGFNIKVHPGIPFFVMQSEKELCLIANQTHSYSSKASISLSYDTCGNKGDLKKAIKCFFEPYHKPAIGELAVAHPMWSTKPGHSPNWTHGELWALADKTRESGFGMSAIIIGNEWESCYGGLEFNKQRFPDPKRMIDMFHERGTSVSLQTHPIIGPGCEDILNIKDFAPYVTSWPNGTLSDTYWWTDNYQDVDVDKARFINLTDPAAIKWYISRLENLKETYGVDFFEFDYREAAFISAGLSSEKVSRINYPGQYIENYIKIANKFGNFVEAGVQTDDELPRLQPQLLESKLNWGSEDWGLKSVLPRLFQLTLQGYSLIIPDLMGRGSDPGGASSEFFIRWVQMITFLPVIRLSGLLWDFDNRTVEITRNYTHLHYLYKDRIMEAVLDKGNPVINPIWWISPHDKFAQEINSEYLLGTELLVAPVLEEGASSRDIYLPEGTWRDENYGLVYTGPTYVYNYSAPLNILPFFEKVKAM